MRRAFVAYGIEGSEFDVALEKERLRLARQKKRKGGASTKKNERRKKAKSEETVATEEPEETDPATPAEEEESEETDPATPADPAPATPMSARIPRQTRSMSSARRAQQGVEASSSRTRRLIAFKKKWRERAWPPHSGDMIKIDLKMARSVRVRVLVRACVRVLARACVRSLSRARVAQHVVLNSTAVIACCRMEEGTAIVHVTRARYESKAGITFHSGSRAYPSEANKKRMVGVTFIGDEEQ